MQTFVGIIGFLGIVGFTSWEGGLHKSSAKQYTPIVMTETTNTIPGLEFLTFVLESLVDDRDELKVDGRIDDLGILLTVQVSDRDMGKLIGKGGQTVKALRTLIRVIGGNSNQRINIKILEPDGSSHSPSPV